MTLKTRIGLAGVLLGGVLLVTAGCGGGGGSAKNTTPSTNAATTTTTASSSGLGGLASAANCRQLADLGSKLAAAFTGGNQDIQRQATLLKQFADQTPPDIRPDFEILAGAFTKIAAALKGVNPGAGHTLSAAQLAKLATLSSQINQAKVRQAAAHISDWATRNCRKP